jgi:hypothetical protein
MVRDRNSSCFGSKYKSCLIDDHLGRYVRQFAPDSKLIERRNARSVVLRHDGRRGRDSNAVPSSDSIPASPCPPAFVPIGTRVLHAAALGSRRLCDCGWLGCTRPFHRKGPARLSSLSESNSDLTRLRALPLKRLTSSYYFRHSSKHAQTKPNSLGHRLSGTAFGWSSFLTFVSRRSLTLRSAPPVNPACAALRGAYTKIAPCSLPRPKAPLRSGD